MTLLDVSAPVRPASPAPVPAATPVPESAAVVSRWLDPLPTPAGGVAALTWPSLDKVWTYRGLWHEEWPVPGNVHPQIRVTHVPSRLFVDYDGPARTVLFDHVATGKTAAAISAQAVDILHAHSSTDPERVAALAAVVAFDAVGAYCNCDGLLHYGRSGWRHVNACAECLHSTAECTDPADRAKWHKGCANPAPVQCEHANCRKGNTYEASQGCGADKRCCGWHDCDTAMPAEERAARADPLDGQVFQVIPAPQVAELHSDRPQVLSGAQWALLLKLQRGEVDAKGDA